MEAKTKRVINLIILDASGSMGSIYEQALTGVNETLATIRLAQKEHPELIQSISLASFSSGEKYLNRIFSNMPVEGVRDITREDYPLLGCTALYDAMGEMIMEVRKMATADDCVLVTVITDGYENASRRWNGTGIKALVEQLKEDGWTFTYIGANQDVEKVAESIGVTNSLCFEATEEGTKMMFAKEQRCRSKFFSKMAFNVQNNIHACLAEDDYFEEK